MKMLLNVVIGMLTVLSSCLGAKIAATKVLNREENKAKVYLVVKADSAEGFRMANQELIDVHHRITALKDSLKRDSTARADDSQARAQQSVAIRRAIHDEQGRYNTMCQEDWRLATSSEERFEALHGSGALIGTSSLGGGCSMDQWGRVMWIPPSQ